MRSRNPPCLPEASLRPGPERRRRGTCCRRRSEASAGGRCRKQSRVPLRTTVAAAAPPGSPQPHMAAAAGPCAPAPPGHGPAYRGRAWGVILPVTPGTVVQPTAGQCGRGISPLPASDWLSLRTAAPPPRLTEGANGGCAPRGAVGDGKMAAGSSGGPGAPCRHHAQLGACESRAKYREGWRPRAVKVGGGWEGVGRSRCYEGAGGGRPGLRWSPAAPRGGEGEKEAVGLACCAAELRDLGICVCAQCTTRCSGTF